jgi:hypothetical protein
MSVLGGAKYVGEKELHFLFIPSGSPSVYALSRLNAPCHVDAQGCPADGDASECCSLQVLTNR